jgi:hypothetical protein
LVVMLSSSLVVLGFFRPSLWTRASQVIPNKNVLMTSLLARSGSSLHCLEKHQIYSHRVSFFFYQQF